MKKKLNYKKLILANAFLVVLYLFIAVQLSYDFIEQCLFACIFALTVILFNLFITEN